MRHKAGFTLIEIMVSLVLVGLIASIAGTLVITATRGYLYARENDAIAQKAQLAIGRLNRELTELMDVKTRDDAQPYLIYEVPLRTGGVERRGIAKVGNTVQMFFNVPGSTLSGLTGDILVDNVQTLSLMYNPSSGVSLWSMGQDIRNLFAVSVQIVLNRPDTGGAVSFFTTVSPRNNNNAGGAALPSAANPPPEYSGKQCFVTTAAYGDADHPVVIVLRQFRDRFLLPSEPGKALVRYYYEVGPSLAAAIKDRPLACLLVRLFVTPVAGFALLSLSCPVMIPLILLLSWGFARLVLKALQRRSIRWRSRLQGQRGAILVTLIAAMVVFAALGAVMISMFGTAAMSQASGNYSQRAYYLAESGFRYAASRYIAVDLGSESANETARETLLESDLHGKTFSLGGDGVFRLDIYPFYYKSTQAPTGNELPAKVSGGLPLSILDYRPGSWVKVIKPGTTTPEYIRIAGVSTLAPYTIRFYRIEEVYPPSVQKDWGASFSTGSLVTPVCLPDRDVNSLRLIGPDSDGRYDLAVKADSGAQAFPEKNGTFMVKFYNAAKPTEPVTKILSYRKLDLNNHRLKGISDPNGGSLPTGPMEDPGTTPASYKNFVELTKFMRIDSTGTFGTGSAAVNRKVTYFTPVGYAKAQPVPKSQSHDQMLNFTGWLTGDNISRIGSLTAGTSYGSTMRVSSAQSVYTLPGGSCVRFTEFQVGLNLSTARLSTGGTVYPAIQQEWLRAGNYLSYDLEMKTFYTLISPMAKYGVGLTFRLDDKGNALGVTFARGVPGFDMYGCDNDGIPYGWLYGYPDYTPMLLFWMKQYEKQETNLYVEPSPHSVPTKFDDPPPVGTGTYAIISYNLQNFWENGERVRFTNTSGALPTGIVPGRDYYIRKVLYNSNVYLYLFSTVTGALNQTAPYWAGLVDITDYGSGTTTIIAQEPTFTKLAHQVLTPGNEYYGLIASMSYLKSWATFAARVIEAPSVSFINGGGSAGREILSGETVYQTSNNQRDGTVNAIYKVMRSPFYRAAKTGGQRLWSLGTEQGVLMLERITGESLSDPSTAPFTSGSKIFVGEHPGGTDAGTVGVPGGVGDVVFRKRDNWVLLYVGDPTGKAPADTYPFNNYRGPILRDSVLWPPDNPEDTVINTDTFTLIRFSDYVNPSLNCKVNGVDRTGVYCLTGLFSKENTGTAGDVLRFTSPDGVLFYTPQSGVVFPTGRAEVGLHAFGADAPFAEFDDFGLQFGPSYGVTRSGFLLPIQQ
jgi:prepilin-type N-terminal cleavage/methylation domain-containing protein